MREVGPLRVVRQVVVVLARGVCLHRVGYLDVVVDRKLLGVRRNPAMLVEVVVGV